MVVACGGYSGHVEAGAHSAAATEDSSFATHRAAVAVKWS